MSDATNGFERVACRWEGRLGIERGKWNSEMRRQIAIRLVALLLVAGSMMLLLTSLSSAAPPPCQPPLTERQRYGFVASVPDWAQVFDIGQLRAGWYVDFAYTSHSTPPEGMDRALLLRTAGGSKVDAAVLGPVVDRYPGAIWLIGNEPDCIWQDNVWPEEYARIYHDLYVFIKNRDLSSRIAPGGIVQATPLRLEYLDRTLAAYQARYGQAMPVDLWNIHNAILNEQEGSWGADIPPGIDASEGAVRAIDDNDNMTLFADQIWAFRQWMADNGYGGYPLVVTEYGVLMPDDYGFDVNRVNAFMTATFDFFETATDPLLGDPNDGNRLVQRWAWFSLDTPPWNPVTGEGFNGNLFDPATAAITAFGQHYAGHTSTFPPLSYVDLSATGFHIPPISSLASPTQTITRSLEVGLANLGTVNSGSFAVTLAYDGPLSGSLPATVANLPPTTVQWLSFTLTNLPPGSYHITVDIDTAGQVAESLECNNQATTVLIAPTDRLYLPLVSRQWSVVSGQLSAVSYQQSAVSGQLSAVGYQRSAISGQLSAVGYQRLSVSSGLPASPLSWLIPNAEFPIPNPQSPATTLQEFELPVAGSYPAQIAVDGQGRVWVSERDGNRIGCFDPASQTWQEYDIPTANSQPWGLALDTGGNVWFAETAADQIGRLEVASGTITEYTIPCFRLYLPFIGRQSSTASSLLLPSAAQSPICHSQPWGLALGPGGAVWFTQKAANRIGKLAPSSGEFTAYPLPTPGSQPTGIDVRGTYVWFTESAADKLGRLDSTSGDITEKSRPAGSHPQDIALTTAGKPWFTEPGANRIVLFDPSTLGWVLEVEAATADSEPYNLAIEDDVAIWFTERAGNKLGRFSGRIPPYEYSLPTPNRLPTGITIDGDGCAWYTAPGANRIGHLCRTVKRVYLPLLFKNAPLGR
jgi:streptogramin lyase